MQGETPLYQRDPHAWEAYLAEENAKQPRKRVSADALICDEAGRVLLIEPRYEPGWGIPGGMAEANESPAACVQRELREELGLDITPAGPLCVDWVPPDGPWDDLLAFVFDGGVLPYDRAGDIRLLDGELASFEFCEEAEVERRLRPRAWHRMRGALAAARSGRFYYLQDGNQWIPALPGGRPSLTQHWSRRWYPAGVLHEQASMITEEKRALRTLFFRQEKSLRDQGVTDEIYVN